MKIRVYDEFGALNSREVFSAFESGLYENGDTQTKSFEEADVVVIWSVLFAGRMAPNREVWLNAVRSKKPVVVLEVGALKRGVTWKVGVGGINRKATFVEPFEDNRFEKLGLKLEPWKEGPGVITIFTQRPDSQQWEGLCSVEEWCSEEIKQIRKHTNRKIVIRPHPRDHITQWSRLKECGVEFSIPKKIGNDSYDHKSIFDKSYAVVNYSSGPSIQTVISGIHTICSSESLAFDVCERYDTIENPMNKDRTEWAKKVAHTEWTVDEIKKGIPWNRLRLKM